VTSTLKFRNLDVRPSDPVELWPPEAIQAVLERGSISDYRRVMAAIRLEPWGAVARTVEHVLTYSQPYGSAALFTHGLQSVRNRAEAAEKAEVAWRLATILAATQLTQAEFASRMGTSASRMSTYLKATVTPSATLLVRGERLRPGA
jgi:hypothetical protein